MFMTYCINCGEELPKDALFCSKCGAKAGTGTATTPSDEMRETLTRMSHEMEKAFTIAAREMQEAFKVARNNIQKTIYKEPVVCASCGEKNAGSASYCFKCGNNLTGKTAEKTRESN